MKISEPKLSDYREERILKKEKDVRIDDGIFAEQECFLPNNNQQFDGCEFIKVNFTETRRRNSFVDCIFDHCDMSNMDFGQCTFRRCVFDHCRMVGIDLSESGMQDVSFVDDHMGFANLAAVSLKRVSFERCMLNEASFNDAHGSDIYLDECRMNDCEFLHTALPVDVSTCELDGIRISPDSMKGWTVSPLQAVALMPLLGIKVKD